MNLKNKNVLVLGLSKSGIAAAKLAIKKGANVYLSNSSSASNESKNIVDELTSLGIKIELGEHSAKFMELADIVVSSPGIPPHSEVLQNLKKLNKEIISEVEFAYRNTNIPFIAITGTNGKTTTTALTEFILDKEKKVKACGNIGLPPSDLCDNNYDYLVCELSSYQLALSKYLKPYISAWTNFTPDHIDWHEGLDNYFEAKAKIFTNFQTPKYAVINATDEKLLKFSKNIACPVVYFGKDISKNACYIKDSAIYYKFNDAEEKIIELSQIPLIGEHNYQNIMCSIICAKLIGISNTSIYTAVKNFKAPAHRLEFVAQYNGIKFYNDSKATNPEASIVAINSFAKDNVTLIAGGRDKNTDLTEFCQSVNLHITNVILIGEATARFKENLSNNGFKNIYIENSLEDAIDKGISLNSKTVLLSPACASFDMFTSYENRGDVFKNYVLSKI